MPMHCPVSLAWGAASRADRPGEAVCDSSRFMLPFQNLYVTHVATKSTSFPGPLCRKYVPAKKCV